MVMHCYILCGHAHLTNAQRFYSYCVPRSELPAPSTHRYTLLIREEL